MSSDDPSEVSSHSGGADDDFDSAGGCGLGKFSRLIRSTVSRKHPCLERNSEFFKSIKSSLNDIQIAHTSHNYSYTHKIPPCFLYFFRQFRIPDIFRLAPHSVKCPFYIISHLVRFRNLNFAPKRVILYLKNNFMPEIGDGELLLRLNRVRCTARGAELAAVQAFADREGNPTRVDILRALNRMSSMLYLLLIQMKAN